MDIEQIEKVVSDVMQVSIDQMHNKTRQREVVWARQLTMYFARKMTKLSLAAIGGYFDKDHATALHAHRRIVGLLSIGDCEAQEALQIIGRRLSHAEGRSESEAMEKPIFIITTIAPDDIDWGLPVEPSEDNEFNGRNGYVNVSVRMQLTGSGNFSEYVIGDKLDLNKLSHAIMMGDIELKGYSNL